MHPTGPRLASQAAPNRWSEAQEQLRAQAPDWARLAPQLHVRVGSRAARVADALHAGRSPAACVQDVLPLGPRLALDLVVPVEGELVAAAPLVRAYGMPVNAGFAVALRDPRRWLRPGSGGDPGTVHRHPFPGMAGVVAIDIHDTNQLTALLVPSATLGLGTGLLALPLSPAQLLVCAEQDLDAIRCLLALAEGARDRDDVVCVELHARTDAPTGAFAWTPWRPGAAASLGRWAHRISLLQDVLDDKRTLQAWQAHQPAVVVSPLRLAQDPQAAGGWVSVAHWPRSTTSLPAADCFDVDGPDATTYRVWGDSILQVLHRCTTPVAGSWPPRFLTHGACPDDAWAQIRTEGQRVSRP